MTLQNPLLVAFRRIYGHFDSVHDMPAERLLRHLEGVEWPEELPEPGLARVMRRGLQGLHEQPSPELREIGVMLRPVVGRLVRHLSADLARDAAILKFGFAVPNEAAIEVLARHGPIVEVGAGLGYWAWCLRQLGVDVVATDNSAPQEGAWTEVLFGEASDTAAARPDRTLLIIWPPLHDPMAAQALKAHRDAGGKTVAYVGEWRGCTADEEFHEILEEQYETVEDVRIPTWDIPHDRLRVHRWLPPEERAERHALRDRVQALLVAGDVEGLEALLVQLREHGEDFLALGAFGAFVLA